MVSKSMQYNDLNSFKNCVVINGSNFYLKNFDLSLVREEYLGWLRNKKINKYLINAGQDISLEQIKEYCLNLLSSCNNIFLGLFIKDENHHIGNVRLGPMDIKSKVCQFSMMIGDPRYHGIGLGTEIVSVCIQYCFRDLGMQKFFLEVIDDNKAAIRIYEKNGLTTEGLLKKHLMLDGHYHDLRIMSVLKESE